MFYERRTLLNLVAKHMWRHAATLLWKWGTAGADSQTRQPLSADSSSSLLGDCCEKVSCPSKDAQ